MRKVEKHYYKKGVNYILVIKYGLQKIGEQTPYFSITGELWKATKAGKIDKRYNCWVCGGCIHEDIQKAAPEFADLIKFHLRDFDGAPMYPVEDGWYYYTHMEEYGHALKNHLLVDNIPEFKDKEEFTQYIEMLRPMWKQKADDLIEKFSLDK